MTRPATQAHGSSDEGGGGPSDDAWNAVWRNVGVKIAPRPPELVKAAWLYDRDGYLGTEALTLCALHRHPPIRDEAPNVVDVIARTLGYRPPTDGLIGSGLERMMAYQRAHDVAKALGLPLDLSAETLRRWAAGEVIHLWRGAADR